MQTAEAGNSPQASTCTANHAAEAADAAAARELGPAFAWLFGPAGVMALPEGVASQLGINAVMLSELRSWLGPADDAQRLQQRNAAEAEQRHVEAFRRLLGALGMPCGGLSMEQWRAERKAQRRAQQVHG